MNSKFLVGTFAVVAFSFSSVASAGVVVIVNPEVKATSLTEVDVREIYLGRTDMLPDGTKVAPVDLAEGSATRIPFLEKIVGKSEFQFRSFWTRQLFNGKGRPPRVVTSDADVVRLVASEKGLIGYVDSKSISPRVKVLLQMN